jgi:hypothetical protein
MGHMDILFVALKWIRKETVHELLSENIRGWDSNGERTRYVT